MRKKKEYKKYVRGVVEPSPRTKLKGISVMTADLSRQKQKVI